MRMPPEVQSRNTIRSPGKQQDPHLGPHGKSPQSEPESTVDTLKITHYGATNTTQSPVQAQIITIPKTENDAKITKLRKKITSHPTLSPFRRKTYLTLLSIPPGKWTTYASLAKYLDSSARAVGTAMRMNPFAPDVPCHRVLSVDRSLGGYMGTPPASASKGIMGVGKGRRAGTGTGNKGQENLNRKRRILEAEGVRFDTAGKAVGEVFLDFTT